jgi:hypothetical protein
MHPFFQKLNTTPQPIQDFFMSNDPRLLCEEVCMMYGLPESAIPAVTKPLGVIFIKEMALSEYPRIIAEASSISAPVAYGVAFEVNSRIFLRFSEYFLDAGKLSKEWGVKKSTPVIGLEEAKKKVLELEPWILEEQAAVEAENILTIGSYEKIPLLSALGKYPKLGEQLVTRERIRVKSQPEPVRPSLSNWIRVYRDELGVGYHDPMLRGKFIFNSDNCKKLSSEERERLNLVLRSIEENVAVDIDPAKTEIVFPEFRSGGKEQSAQQSSIRQSSPGTPAFAAGGPVGSSQPVRRSAQPAAAAVAKPIMRTPVPVSPSTEPSVGSGRFQPRPFVPTPSAPLSAPPAPARRPVSFVPAPPPDLPVGGSFSFSSSHALPVESEDGGDFSIRNPEAPSLPSGQAAFGATGQRFEAVPPSIPARDTKAAPPLPPLPPLPPAPDMNPFHIHPVSTRDGEGALDAGRTIDLRADG